MEQLCQRVCGADGDRSGRSSRPPGPTPVNEVSPASSAIPRCQSLGGYAGFSTTGSAICYSEYAPIEPLVEESDSYSLFTEYNHTLGGLDFHVEGLGYYRELPEISVLLARVRRRGR